MIQKARKPMVVSRGRYIRNSEQKISPPPRRVEKSLGPGSHKWAPCSFLRLFRTCGTCTPKPGRVPFFLVLGQGVPFNHAHSRGAYFYYALNHMIDNTTDSGLGIKTVIIYQQPVQSPGLHQSVASISCINQLFNSICAAGNRCRKLLLAFFKLYVLSCNV